MSTPHYTGPSRPWKNSLCGCCSPCGTCCLGFHCPCILFSRTSYRMAHNGSTDGHGCCTGTCTFYCLAQLITPVRLLMSRNLRKQIREVHGLEGGTCGDCFKACCCECCSLVQQDKEVAHRFEEREKAGYQKQGGMVYGQA